VTFWVNHEGSCLGCCVATLVGVHPCDLPNVGESGDDRDELNEWLQANHGKRLELVWGERLADAPQGWWIAQIARGPLLTHAVLAQGSQVIHDPALADGAGHLWAGDLAAAHDPELALGWRLVSA